MAITSYDVGDVAHLSFSFALSGVALNPTAVSVIVQKPDGVKTTYVYGVDGSFLRPATGSYTLDVPITLAGRHYYRVVATGTGAEVGESYFEVRTSAVI